MSPTASKPEVLVTRSDFPESGIDILRKYFRVEIWDNVNNGPLDKKKLIELIQGKYAVYASAFDIYDEDVIKAGLPFLRVISTFSVGVDHIDLRAVKDYDIKLGHTPDVSTEATSEFAIALLLSASRRMQEAASVVREGRWLSWTPLGLCGQGIQGSTVGIIGYGRIGHAIAVKLKVFSPQRILYASRREKLKGNKIGAIFVDLNSLLRSSDFVILCCALTSDTNNMMSWNQFAAMRKNAIFVNVVRGGLVNHDALVDALRNRKIRAAGLDVMAPEPLPIDHPLQKLDNCVIMPHIGSATVKAREDMGILVAKNIVAVLKGERMPAEYSEKS
ncbi:unnamed protein product [Bemisia tabaci]|uniref:Glyoxylate reductase/hydroxypyruvate reductase n=1 Tax=Bemisia tabaci TaxID=7038 RepID=A0A9N9ZYF4_BEMTA|nr:unnamed protein product [Bemisia tabaci]